MYMPEVKTLYNRLKQSAKKRGISFELKLTDLYEIDYPLTCPVLGIPMKFNKGKAEDNSYSFDRVDSSIGYTIDNMQVVSNKANRLKNNATAAELKQFALYYSA
jgi:hypothetical protein